MRGFSFRMNGVGAIRRALDESQFWACIERQIRDPKLSSAVLDLNGSEGCFTLIGRDGVVRSC